jgi:hypothetical protein
LAGKTRDNFREYIVFFNMPLLIVQELTKGRGNKIYD